MRFEWDESKNELNIRQHNIDFADAQTVFAGPMIIWLDDREDYGEVRWTGAGFLKNIIVVIIFSEPENERRTIMSDKDLKKKSRTNWAKLESMTDEEIDYADIPPLDDAFFTEGELRMPKAKPLISIRIDPEVLSWFKSQGPGYQTRMNAVLRMYMEAQERKPGKAPT